MIRLALGAKCVSSASVDVLLESIEASAAAPIPALEERKKCRRFMPSTSCGGWLCELPDWIDKFVGIFISLSFPNRGVEVHDGLADGGSCCQLDGVEIFVGDALADLDEFVRFFFVLTVVGPFVGKQF